MEITRIEELKNIGDIIELTPFNDGTKLNVKVKKPDIVMMMIDGKIPNPLIETTMSMTESGELDLKKDNAKSDNDIDLEKTKKWVDFLRIIASECLISPSYAEFENAGIKLNIAQLTDIYKYATSEVEHLKSFRSE